MQRQVLSAAILYGVVAAILIDLERIVTTVLPVHGSIAGRYAGIAAMSLGGAVPPFAAAFGIALHLAVSIGWAVAYARLATQTPALVRSPFSSGLSFGIVVYIIMDSILLSIGHYKNPAPGEFANAVIAHTIFFGLPIAYGIAHTLKSTLNQTPSSIAA